MRLVIFLCAMALVAQAGLPEIKQEPNLEKRARLAVDNAGVAFERAKSDYAAGKIEETGKALEEMQASIELARDSLHATGKNARRSPKHFKYAEKETQGLLRKIDGLENAMYVEDRKLIEGPKAKVEEVHDQWLHELMSGKK